MTLNDDARAEVEEGVSFVDRAPRLMQIFDAVSAVYGVGKMDMISLRRFPRLVGARDAFYWAARTWTPRTYTEIGYFFGRRDHSTVWSGIVRVDARFEKHRTRLAEVQKRLGLEGELKP